MANANQAPLPRLSEHRWYVLRLLSGTISSTWIYLYLLTPVRDASLDLVTLTFDLGVMALVGGTPYVYQVSSS